MKIRKKWARCKVCGANHSFQSISSNAMCLLGSCMYFIHLWVQILAQTCSSAHCFGYFLPSKRDHLRFISNISICKVWILEKSVEIDRIRCVRFRSVQQRMIFHKVSVWYIKTHMSVTNRHCAHKIVWFCQDFMGILRQCVIIEANIGEKYQNWYEKSRICVFPK